MKTFKVILLVLLLGLPILLSFPSESFADVKVRGYYRKDGTYVKPHYRSDPDSSINNNWSTKGNVNPHTGKPGTVDREPNGSGYKAPTTNTYRAPVYIAPTRRSTPIDIFEEDYENGSVQGDTTIENTNLNTNASSPQSLSNAAAAIPTAEASDSSTNSNDDWGNWAILGAVVAGGYFAIKKKVKSATEKINENKES